MDQQERMQLTAKLKKLFPNVPNLAPRWTHVYGHTVCSLRFSTSFTVFGLEGIRKELVRASMVEFRTFIDNIIKDMDNVQLESESTGTGAVGDDNLSDGGIGATHTGEDE